MNPKHKRSYLMMLPALGLSVALTGHAAGTGAGTASRPADSTAATSATQGTTAAKSPAAAPATMAAGDVRASKLLGKNLENAQGQNVGEIEDLVIDTANGKVHYAVVGFGGFLGVGEKRFAFPLDKFQVGQGDKIMLNVDKEKLKDMPGFERNNWPDFNRGEYRAQVDRYHSVQPSGATTMRFVRASQIMKGDVKDSANKDIGDIKDFVVNLKNGQVHYVVIEFDRAWNPNDKLVAMPMRAFRSEDRDGTDLVYTASRNELANAPSFDRNRWPDAGDAKFRADVDRYTQSWRDRPVTARSEATTRTDAAPGTQPSAKSEPAARTDPTGKAAAPATRP